MADLVIRNGMLVTPSGVVYGGLAVEGEQICHIGANNTLPPARRVIDAEGHYVMPGFIDAHVHMGGVADANELIPVETDGALHGGVTAFGHFVANKEGSLVSAAKEYIAAAESYSRVDFFIHAVIHQEFHLKEQAELCRTGITSFKHFFDAHKHRPEREPPAAFGPVDPGILYRSFEFVGKWGAPAVAMAHCEDIEIIDALEIRLRDQGRKDLAAWTEARPSLVEYSRIAFAVDIAKAVKAPLYVVHISTAEGVDIVSEARREGYPVWGETGVQWLTHTCDQEVEIGCWGKMKPSLKSWRDIDRLWRGICDGGITNLGSDHVTRGRTPALKEGGGGKYNNIWNARAGLAGGVEHSLPIMMTFGVHAGRISIEDLVRIGATTPAKVFGLYPKKGVLAVGSDADIVIVDADKEALIDSNFYRSLCETSIYAGCKVKGMARVTLLRGTVAMEDYKTLAAPGTGKYLPRPATWQRNKN